MNYCIVVGDFSADAYAAQLVYALKIQDTQANCFGFGGEQMKVAGVDILVDLQQLSFMGFGAVLKQWKTIKYNFNLITTAIINKKADVVILLDYAGFNLKLAKWCKKNNIKVVYFILPKTWAWNEKRIKTLQQCIDLNIGIFPFEINYFKEKGLNINYYGNPSAYNIEQYKKQNSINPINKKCIALFPGSRKQELHYILPTMLNFAKQNTTHQFVIAGISSLKQFYPTTLPQNVSINFDNNYTIMQQTQFAIACSGTVSLELALFNINHLVVYRTGFWHYQIGKILAKVKYISLPNLIENKLVVTELIQTKYTLNKLQTAFNFQQKKSIYFNSSNLFNKDLYNKMANKIIKLNK